MRPVVRELLLAALGPAVALPMVLLGMFVPFRASLYGLQGRVIHSIFREWGSDGPGSWAILAMLVVAASYPVRALLLLRRREDTPPPGSATLGLLATLGSATSATSALMAVGDVHLVRRAIQLDQAQRMDFYFFLQRDVDPWAITGGGLVILAALWAVVGVIATRRRRIHAAALLLPLAAVVGLVGASLLRYSAEIEGLPWLEGTPPADRYRSIVATGAPLSQGGIALVVVAALAAAAILILTRRDALARIAPRDLRASAGVLALGLSAFVLTRGMAHDARHPLPLWEPDGGFRGLWSYVNTLPHGEHCRIDFRDAPMLRFDENGSTLDGVRVSGQAIDGFRELLVNWRELWKQETPNRPFPGILAATIPADLPMSRVRPFIEAAREAGYPQLDLFEGLPARTFATRTMGVLEYSPRLCFVTANANAPVPATGPLGEWASELARP